MVSLLVRSVSSLVVAAGSILASPKHNLITTQICASAKSIQIDHNHIIVAYEYSDLQLCSEKLLLLLRFLEIVWSSSS
jgi:hypothetical protein